MGKQLAIPRPVAIMDVAEITSLGVERLLRYIIEFGVHDCGLRA